METVVSALSGLPVLVAVCALVTWGLVKIVQAVLTYRSNHPDPHAEFRDDILRAYTELREEQRALRTLLEGSRVEADALRSQLRDMAEIVHQLKLDLLAISARHPEIAEAIHVALERVEVSR